MSREVKLNNICLGINNSCTAQERLIIMNIIANSLNAEKRASALISKPSGVLIKYSDLSDKLVDTLDKLIEYFFQEKKNRIKTVHNN